jgi:hypothetical protein
MSNVGHNPIHLRHAASGHGWINEWLNVCMGLCEGNE